MKIEEVTHLNNSTIVEVSILFELQDLEVFEFLGYIPKNSLYSMLIEPIEFPRQWKLEMICEKDIYRFARKKLRKVI